MTAVDEQEDDLIQADWVDGEAGEDLPDPWRVHLRRQAARAAVAAVVALFLWGARNGGESGRWVVERMRRAVEYDFTPAFRRLAEAPAWKAVTRGLRGWFAREWRVSGARLQSETPPPALSWPVSGGRLMLRSAEAAVDLQVPAGTPVKAAAAGVTSEVRAGDGSSWTIVVQHDGGWRTSYGQCAESLVRAGDRVAAGQTIALVGTARPPTPAHLRFELWGPRGQVDPLLYLKGGVERSI